MPTETSRPKPANLRTLNDVFFAVTSRDIAAVMSHRRTGQWSGISCKELYKSVSGVAQALRGWGVSKGDRVAILSENRPEWTIADFACLSLGVVVVPVYTTLTGEQTSFLLRDSGARAIFVSSESQLQKILGIQHQTPIEKIVVMDSVETTRADHIDRLHQEGKEAPDIDLETQARAVQPDDLATIIYTSGTTGAPKGAMLTHGNLASNIACSLDSFGIRHGDTGISFLPLSHVTARHVDFALLYHGACLAYVPSVDKLPQALLEIHPTIFVGVPRVYEKVHAQVDLKAKGFPKRQLYHWALSVGRKHRDQTLAGKTSQSLDWKIADRLLFSKVRAGMGGKAEILISGGAPLGRELAEWYAQIGIRIHEGYGLTETSPVIAVNTPTAHRIGTVGRPLSNVEVRVADDGEILVRGPSVFKGYWNLTEETEKAFVDGWFKTGDIGNLDADGFLSVTDRKKDLIKTSGGKFIAPQPMENSLKHNPLVAEALILGDKRKFPAVMVLPHFPLLEDWAHNNHVDFTSRAELIANPKVRALYEGIVADFNGSLARFEKLKKVLIIAEDFTAENGTLTASMKMRRKFVEERHSREIEQMYANAEEETPVSVRGE